MQLTAIRQSDWWRQDFDAWHKSMILVSPDYPFPPCGSVKGRLRQTTPHRPFSKLPVKIFTAIMNNSLLVCHSKIGPGEYWSGRTLFASRFGLFPQNRSAFVECIPISCIKKRTSKFRDCVIVKMGSFRKTKCIIAKLLSRDSPEVQYNLVNWDPDNRNVLLNENWSIIYLSLVTVPILINHSEILTDELIHVCVAILMTM